MDLKKKFALLEEVMDLEEGTLTAETLLDDLAEWDSMSKLSFIVMMEDEFDKKVNAEQVRNFKTVQDMLDCMN
jgi:acyl carrier protein